MIFTTTSPLRNALLCFLHLAIASLSAHAQEIPAQFKRWQVDDGLPQNSVGQVIQTRDGYLWVPTQGGLARFDGVRFEVFDVKKYPALKSNRISTLMEDRAGRLFIGTLGGGVVVYEDHTFKNISEPLGIAKELVGQITQDKLYRIWIVTANSGVLVLDGKTLRPIKEMESLKGVSAQNIFETSSGEMILEMGRNTRVWKNGALIDTAHQFYQRLPDAPHPAIFLSATNTLWICGPTSLFQIRDNRLVEQYVIPAAYRYGNYTLGLFQLYPHEMLLSFNNSDRMVVFNMDKGQFQLANIDLQCPGTRIKYVYKDREENIWYATSTCGLIRENKFRPEYIDIDPVITNHNIYPIIKDSKARIIIGTHNSGLEVIENKRSVDAPVKRAVENFSYPYSIVEFEPDDYYIVCNAQVYVTRSNKGKTTVIPNPDKNHAFRALYKTRSNNLLACSSNGLFQINGGEIVHHSLFDKLRGVQITSFFEDDKGNLWLLSDNNLFCYNESTKVFKRFKEGPDFTTKYLRGSCEDKEGRLYFGSYGYGMLVYDSSRFYELTVHDGLLENVVSTITDDGKGNLWLTGNSGLTKLRKQNVIDFLKKKDTKLNPILFDRSDGLRSAEFNGGIQQSKCEIENNVFLFPTLNGCVKIDFNVMTDNVLPAPVVIESIKTEDSTYLADRTNTIPFNEGRVEFNFTALSFSAIKNIKFKYQLEGYDEGWQAAGTDRKTSYTKLSPGSYTFRVIASNSDGLWNGTGASVVVTVVPPFYMTWWFRSLVVLSVAFVLSTIVLFVDRRVKKHEIERAKQIQKQELRSIVDAEERERRRIAADLHDSVGQLLTNVKLKIGTLSERHENNSGQDKLLFDNSKKSLQDITTELRNISYNLHPPSLVQFGLVSAIEEEIKNVQLSSKLEIQFVNDTSGTRYNSETELALYRVFQEIVNNVVKHSGATELSIQLIEHETILQLVAEDNGRGFVVEDGFGKKNSNGLKNLQSRVEMRDGKISFDSMPGRGTTVIVEIPLKA